MTIDPVAEAAKTGVADAGLPDLLEPRAILTSIGEVVYDWHVATDVLNWGANADAVLRLDGAPAPATGRAFGRWLDGEAMTNRFEAVVNSRSLDGGDGVAFQIHYALSADPAKGRAKLFIEDTGRWFGGSDRRPARVHGVLRVINERQQSEQRLAFLARTDELTGQMNRVRLTDVLGDLITAAQRYRGSLGFLLIGIEDVAVINEAYGFDIADEVIVAVGRRIRALMRTGDAIGRFSGNKFGVILSRCEGDDLATAAARFLDGIAGEPVQTTGGSVCVRSSIGGVLSPRHARTAPEAIRNAREALQLCRTARPGGFMAYTPSAARTAARRANAKLTDSIVSALNEHRMLLAYEPIVDAVTLQPVLHECLVRLRDPDGGLVSAAAIVPISERLGLVRLIDHRVLSLAVDTLAGHPDACLTLNVSAATAVDQDWLAALAVRLHRRPEFAGRLTVEITESSAIQDLSTMRRFVATMKEYGLKVAIDDFGAGHTSFRGLRDLGVDMVKIDGAFVQSMTHSVDDRFFVRTLIDLARHLDLVIVAEWVQDESAARQLRDWGCHYLQGALFGRATIERPWAKSAEPRTQPVLAALQARGR